MKCASSFALILALFSAGSSAQKMADLDKKELAMLKSLEAEQGLAKAKFDKKPKDAAVKKNYIAATMRLADAQLVTPALPPKQKYPKSLRNYRLVVKLDPKNAVAKQKISTIEGIYKQMGRPIPPN